MLRTDTPQTIYLKDYHAPDYVIDEVELYFDLREGGCIVKSRMSCRATAPTSTTQPLVLHGQELELLSVVLDAQLLLADSYACDDESLTIKQVPERFVLEVTTISQPANNTSLEGLYMSNGMYCTQCEAEGFRKITYYLDRPDVMARFTTIIEADAQHFPVLLSNGNLVDSGDMADGRHWAKWEDPFKKPCYLFALVAGNLECLEGSYRTSSGRDVSLRLYVEPGNLDKCEHAMASLKHAMAWDEQTFGLEYDLDIYMIVAVGDFNMGAMENKGLNVFNTAYVLAKPETATDRDYENIEGVIAHEYFHNWTGNRVTCRDWFQLSLKEGLTVFRDQEFSADMGSRTVKRINDVRMLRARQFPEDAGPMAHSVRPSSYVEVNNFYTATVYEKGAELIRMLHTLLTKDGFRRGMDLYFKRHDGQAVTTDDFVQAMADANDMDLTQFTRWYNQVGTPRLHVSRHYDANTQEYCLEFAQSYGAEDNAAIDEPLHIPIAVSLLDAAGNDLPLRLKGESGAAVKNSRVLELRDSKQRFCFVDVPQGAVPSVLRGFSAPVQIESDFTDEDLMYLLAHDSDEFNRWEAGQQLAVRVMQQLIIDYQAQRPLQLTSGFVQALGKTLDDLSLDKALVAEILVLPSEINMAELMEVVDPDAIHAVRQHVRRALAEALQPQLLAAYQSHATQADYRFTAQERGRRSLKNLALSYLMEIESDEILALALRQFEQADNMTDVLAALAPLSNRDRPERHNALVQFYQQWQHEPLVVNKWFAIQAGSRLPNTLQEVGALLQHPAFEIKNPNKVRALIGTFALNNPSQFHAHNGAAYAFVAQQVLKIDRLNPQVAARLVSAFNRWRKFDSRRQQQMQAQLQTILASQDLSKDVYEIVSKALRQ